MGLLPQPHKQFSQTSGNHIDWLFIKIPSKTWFYVWQTMVSVSF
jgi:hypothetical protein